MGLNILTPLTFREFIEDYYEQKHLHIRRDNVSFFDDILTLDQVDDALFSTTLNHPQNRVVNNALETFPDSKDYTVVGTTRIDPIKFVKKFQEGCTLVLSGLQEKIYSLRKFSNLLESEFGHKVQTNIYITPKGSQGFPPHYDTHDVFVLQISGEKSWRIYENTLFLADTATPFVKGERQPGAIIDEFIMKPGDLLYIPRGVMHDANTNSLDSFHVTTGILGKTWAQHISEMLSLYSKEIPSLRKYTKFHQLPAATKESEIQEIKEAVASLIDNLLIDDTILTEFQRHRKPTMKGMLGRVMNLDRLNLDSVISLSEPENLRIIHSESTLELKFYDISITVPVFCKGFLECLMSNNRGMVLRDIQSELDDEGMLTLSKELISNGILQYECNATPA